MKHLKEYKLWEQSRELTPEQEEFLNQYVKGSWTMNPEGFVDVEGDFDCSSKKIVSLNGIRFGSVGGNFYCHNNQLTSLEGAPREVRGDFYCHENQLTSLEGAPREVKRDFDCSSNQLTSLEGAPREVKRDFYCDRNQLTSLEGAPREVRGGFYCESNPISDETMKLICQKMMENPEMGYGAILASLQSRIPQEDWEKLDKSSMEGITDRAKRGYKLLGGIGGI